MEMVEIEPATSPLLNLIAMGGRGFLEGGLSGYVYKFQTRR